MRSTLCYLATLFLVAQCALAEETRLKLLNPNGTPAEDAKAIAIMKVWSRVDADLKELPSLTMQMPEEGGTKAAKNDAGVVTFDPEAIAVVAQNQTGFVFVPLPLKGDSAMLRPWAKLKVDVSAMDPKRRESQKIAVLWENCFAGNALLPASAVEQEDPFGAPETAPKYDWRFNAIVMWSLSLDAKKEQVVNVPAGEVTIVIGDRDIATADWQKPISHTRTSIVRTRSGNVVQFRAPVMVSVRGELFDADVPDWNGGSGNSRYIFASPAGPENGKMPDDTAQLFTGLDQGTGTILDELAKRYASEAGMNYRYGLMPQATAEVKDDDTFEFPGLPPGKYNLNLFLRSGGAAELKSRGAKEDTPIIFEVTSQSSTLDLGQLVRVQRPEPKVAAETVFAPALAEEAPGPVQALPNEYGSDPLIVAQTRIHAQLAKVIVPLEYQACPLRMVAEELQTAYRIPILLNEQSLATIGVSPDTPVTFKVEGITLQSALRHLLASVSSDLTFVVRDEVLLITSKEDAQSGFMRYVDNSYAEPLDNGAAFIEQWRKTASGIDDRGALRKALQEHLEQEFDANQISRQAELDRLRKLIEKSEEWIKTRQAKRTEIVEKRAMELLEATSK